MSVCHIDECDLDADDIDQNEKVFEFVTITSFVALVSEDSNEPVYILKVEEKGTAEKEGTDGYGYTISTGEYFLRRKYLKMGRSRATRYHKFSILLGNARCTLYTGKSVEIFLEIFDDLILNKETFKALQMRAEAL